MKQTTKKTEEREKTIHSRLTKRKQNKETKDKCNKETKQEKDNISKV